MKGGFRQGSPAFNSLLHEKVKRDVMQQFMYMFFGAVLGSSIGAFFAFAVAVFFF